MVNPDWSRLDSLGASEVVSLSCYCVEESSIDLVFGETGAQVSQALWRVLVHAGLTENPVPVAWRQNVRGREV